MAIMKKLTKSEMSFYQEEYYWRMALMVQVGESNDILYKLLKFQSLVQ